MTMGERYVSTADIRSALAGRETELLDALNIPWRGGKPHIPCPYRAHADDHPSWRWDERKRKAFCTCGARDVLGVLMGVEGTDVDAAKIRAAELLKRPDLIRERKPRGRGGHANPPEQKRKRATPAGCALIAYAAAKGLPADFLLSVGIREINYLSAPALRIPYFGAEDGEPAIRFRLALEGKDRFVWRKGAKARLYGLQRIEDARKAGYIVLVEGETDCCTLWHNGFPALGLPGATNWNEERDAPLLADIPTIYVVIEPDEGGEQMLGWLQRSSIAPRVRLVKLPEKDPNALYLLDRDGFPVAFRQALDEAEPYQVIADRTRANDLHAARQAAGELAGEPDILGQFEKDLKAAGLVGEERNAKVLYLVHTTRVFDRPVSVAVKGVSSGGKSYTVESVLKFFPISTFWTRTALSERALAYSDEDFRRRHLVLFEAAGMTGDIANYLMRSLLSEGRIRYEVVEKTRDGLRPRVIEKDGPTGLIVTTTATRLHPENETRLLSLAVKDTPEQTAAVMLALARDQRTDAAVGYARWHAYQQWLAAGECRVVVPFASRLAQLIQPVAVRLRRDFGLLLQLIRAHTLLHREHRPQDCDGRIIALPADYAAVHNLVADQFAEGVATMVKQTTRDTVDAVKRLAKLEVTVTEIAKELKLDTSAASRRVSEARSSGYLVNNETGKGRPARIALGDPMPTELEILPHPDQLADCCRVAPLQEGIDTPSPHADCDAELAEIEI